MSSVCNKELQDDGVINSDEDEQSSFYGENEFSARRQNQQAPFFAALAPAPLYSPAAGDRSSRRSSRRLSNNYNPDFAFEDNGYYYKNEYNARYSFNSDIEAVKPRKQVASQNDFQQKFKTEICRSWEISKCKFGAECTFAHGEHELLTKSHIHQNYRTKHCKNFYQNLYCSYGNRCQFYHDITPDPVQSETRQSYIKSLNQIQDMKEKLQRSMDTIDQSNDPMGDSFQQRLAQTEKLIVQIGKQIQLQRQNEKLPVFEAIPLITSPKSDIQKLAIANSTDQKLQISSTEFRPGMSARSGNPASARKQNSNYASNSSQNQGNSTRKSKGGATYGSNGQKPTTTNSSTKFQFKNTVINAKNKKTPSKLSDSSSNFNNYSNYKYHDLNNYQMPITQLPHIQQFFPNLKSQRPVPYLNEIIEIMNDNEQIPKNQKRKNSDTFPDSLFQNQNEIKEELEKPSTQQVTSFTENMVFTRTPSIKY